MHDIQNVTTERVDDMPLRLEQMKRMALPTLIDQYFPAHGNRYGLSLGWVSTIWLSSIVSRGDHRLSHREPWVANRLWTLKTATEQEVERLDFTDDRLEIVLRHVSDDSRWAQFESHVNQYTVRGYDLSAERVHVDSTTASAYASVSEEG
jgi:transposase